MRELVVGLLLGIFYGLLLGTVGGIIAHFMSGEMLFGNPFSFGLTISVSLVSAMVIAAIVGSGVPMIFERLSIDPAVATGPFVTTFVDVLGVLVYFATAALFMGI
jgi:magnesium transporter